VDVNTAARVTRRLSPHSEQTPYSRMNPPVRAIRVAARCPVDGSMPTACPRQRSQKHRPRWASKKAATLSLAIIALGYRWPLAPASTAARSALSSASTPSVPSSPARRNGLPSASRSRPWARSSNFTCALDRTTKLSRGYSAELPPTITLRFTTAPGKSASRAWLPVPTPAPAMPYVVRGDVVGEDEAAVRQPLGGDDGARVQSRVVVDHDRRRAIDDLEEPAVPAPARVADIDEQIVPDLDSLRRAPELPPSSAAVTMAAMRSRGAR
jgi:hypothetical protein